MSGDGRPSRRATKLEHGADAGFRKFKLQDVRTASPREVRPPSLTYNAARPSRGVSHTTTLLATVNGERLWRIWRRGPVLPFLVRLRRLPREWSTRLRRRRLRARSATTPTRPLPTQPRRFSPSVVLRQLHAAHPALCLLENADYKECLHRDKLKRRIASKAVEHEAAKHPQPAAGHDHGHH